MPTVATCTVPELIGLQRNRAQPEWSKAGFATTVDALPGPTQNYTIGTQSIAPGQLGACATTTITVGP